MQSDNRGMRMRPWAFVALILVIVALAGTILVRQAGVTVTVGSTQASAEQQAGQTGKQLYYSTMHPWIVQDHPGSCPICGMELVEMPTDMQADWERNHKQA